jgi:hypothetical protein
MECKYTAKFEYEVSASAGSIEGLQISEASLDNLKPLIPESVDLERNIDLLGVAFNAAVVNSFNKNGDGIDSKSAVEIKDYFVHKPTNIEHNRDQVVGHIVSSGFSSYEDSRILSNQEVLSSSEPLNISLAAVVYRNANTQLSEMLEGISEEEGVPTVISTSWELGFNEFAVAIGSKDLKDCEVVYGEEAENLKENLQAFGGEGKLEDGRECHRLVVGEIFPLGVAFTTKPAANVSGVVVANEDIKKNKELVAEKENFNKIKNKSSQKHKNIVIQNKETLLNMETEKLLHSLEALLNEKRRENDFSEEAVASISKLVNDVIIEKSTEWKSQVEEAQLQKKELEASQVELSDKFDLINDELKNTKEKLESLEEENSVRDAAQAFDGRMEALSSEYDLESGDLEVIASEVKALSAEEDSFASYKEKFSKIWAHKNKEFIKSQAEELEAKIEAEVQKRLSSKSEESVSEETEEVVEAALDNAEEKEENIPNNNTESVESEETLSDQFAKAFSAENISIKY